MVETTLKTKDLEELYEVLYDRRDLILMEQCIKFWKKIDEVKFEITSQDKLNMVPLILNIVRVYLMSLREYYSDEEDVLKIIINDLQSSLSSTFKVQETKTGPQLAFTQSIVQLQGADEQKEIHAMLNPFISFVEINIYEAYKLAYSEQMDKVHSAFCQHTAKASGIMKEKKKEMEGLPPLPTEPAEEKPKKRKTKKEVDEEYDK